jgi:hypothetical protein
MPAGMHESSIDRQLGSASETGHPPGHGSLEQRGGHEAADLISAFARMAAATTWRSSLSGKRIPASSSSHPVTSASSKASPISANRFCTSMPGWISSMAAWASPKIRSDQRGRYKPFSAMRSRVSASAIGTNAQASRTAAYLVTSGIVLPGAALAGFLQGGGIVFGAAAVDAS